MTGHQERLRVQWADTDAGGRIHHTAAFRWAELTEHALYRELGVTRTGHLPRRHVEATYHHPLAFGDEVDVLLAVEQVGTSSISYTWQVRKDGTVCIDGRTVVVHVNDNGTPIPIPAALAQHHH